MAAAVQAVVQAAQDRALPEPLAQNQIEQIVQRRVTQLHSHYMEKQKEVIMPWKTLVDSASLIAGVAFAIFSGINGIAAVLLGVGVAGVFAGFGRILMNLSGCLQRNQQAADAIISPGFYEYAIANPYQIASAQKIIETFARFA